MNQQADTIQESCPRCEIVDYIDGELSPQEELELEMHLANCRPCADELNEQKKLLCFLDNALEDENEIELPENFTKVIVTTAESTVSGLRSPQERFRALFICAALFLLVLLGLGRETETVFASFSQFGEQFLAVAGFVFHLFYDIAFGATVILRSLSNQYVVGSAASLAFLGVLFVISLLIFSRLVIRYNRSATAAIQAQEK